VQISPRNPAAPPKDPAKTTTKKKSDDRVRSYEIQNEGEGEGEEDYQHLVALVALLMTADAAETGTASSPSYYSQQSVHLVVMSAHHSD
jgi:hypothetical protein